MRIRPYFLRLGGMLVLGMAATAAQARDYHVDCSAGATQGAAGGSAATISSLDQLNKIRFGPGDRILFKRGSACYGSFQPQPGSSGRAGAPIVVGAYGDPAWPRPVIAAGCREALPDPDQRLTEAGKTPAGISPYRSLCTFDDGDVERAALHLRNVEYWDINTLELSNDGLAAGPRVGLLVELEDFGTAHHFHVNDVYVHHVHGYQQDVAGSEVAYKETGGILFNITRNGEKIGAKQKPSNFDDVLIANSEVYNINGIGVSNRSAWGCRSQGAPCGDYPPYKDRPDYLKDPATKAAGDYFPSTRLVIRNNKIHNIGGDAIIVRTAKAPLVESNLIHDVWMRSAGNSAGAWAINTDDALFQYNEVYGVRKRPGLNDGMAFDADLGTWNTLVRANFSHDNQGGLMLFCGCGTDGLGAQATTVHAVVENNLSLDDGHRIVFINGAAKGVVRNNLIVTRKPGIDAPLIESNKYPTKNEVSFTGNVLVDTRGTGTLLRVTPRTSSLADLHVSGNTFAGYHPDARLPGAAEANTYAPAASQDADALIEHWFATSGFREHRYMPVPQPGTVE